jgi:hypothetical protein
LDIYKCPFLILKKKFVKMIYFVCCFEESYTWSFFILIHVLFVLIQVLNSYTGPIFLAHFQKNPDFSRIFPNFSDFFRFFPIFSYAVRHFFRIFWRPGMLRRGQVLHVKKIMYFLEFFISRFFFKNGIWTFINVHF